VVEATSGNTGIALAMVCAARGYPFVAVMVETFSVERRKIMRALRREGHPDARRPSAARAWCKKAEELAEKHGWFLARQFENPANPGLPPQHHRPGDPQRLRRPRLDYFVSGWGTGGTLTGAGEMLKLARPDTQIIATEPEGARCWAARRSRRTRSRAGRRTSCPAVLNRSGRQIGSCRSPTPTRWPTARALAHKEGIFCGISCGGTFAAGAESREDAARGSVILAMLPDTGERYLSTALFAGRPSHPLHGPHSVDPKTVQRVRHRWRTDVADPA
jgi:cysteine synthase A